MLIRCVDEAGEPVEGVAIHTGIWSEPRWKGKRDFKTNQSGITKAELPTRVQILRIWARKEGYIPLFANWNPEYQNDGSEIPREFTFKLQQGTKIGGRILTEEGQPIRGVAVEVSRSSDEFIIRMPDPNNKKPTKRPIFGMWLAEDEGAITTDDQGRWQLNNVPPGDKEQIRIKLTHPNYTSDEKWGGLQAASEVTLQQLRGQNAVIVMPNGVELSGTVTDPDGKPVAKALVIWGDDPYHEPGNHEVRTNEQGKYQLPPLAQKPIRITIVAEGWSPTTRIVDLREAETLQDFKLEAGHQLKVHFFDPDQKPIKGVGVLVEGWRGSQSLYNHIHPNVLPTAIPRSTNKQGIYLWDWAPRDAVTFSFFKTGYKDAREIPLTAGLMVHTITLVPEAEKEVPTAEVPELQAEAAPQKSKPNKKKRPNIVNTLEETDGLTYSGIVVNKRTGKPIENANVLVRLKTSSVHPWPTLKETTYQSDAQGRYDFRIMPEQLADKYLYIEVEATHPAHARKSPSGYALSMIRKNEKLGEEPFFAKMELQPAEKVFGTLTQPDGEPAVGVNVLGYSRQNPKPTTEYGSFSETETNERGRFQLNMIADGHSVIWIRPDRFAPETHVLKQQKGDLGEIKLSEGVRLSGVVKKLDGKPIANVWVNAELRSGKAKKAIQLPVADQIERSALTDANGKFQMKPLPPGRYKLLPEERPTEGTIKDRKPRAFDATFLPKLLGLEDSQPTPEVMLQAVESVLLRAKTLDSNGNSTKGHGFHFSGQLDDKGEGFYWRAAQPDPQGVAEIRVPKGLKRTEMRFMTNEHGALRIRLERGKPLSANRDIDLGELNRDYGEIEIVRYKAPILLVEATDEHGQPIEDSGIEIIYSDDQLSKEKGTRYFNAGERSDVGGEYQDDGRWRSSQLLPDEAFRLRVSAGGYQDSERDLELVEGETREVRVELKRALE